MDYLEESGMRFYRDAYCWEPEQTSKAFKWDYVKACDLVRKKGKKLCFIEAKTTAPKDQNLKDYIEQIALKFENTLTFFYGLYTGRTQEKNTPLPYALREEKIITQQEHLLILVVKEHPKRSLYDLEQRLKQHPLLKSLLKTLDLQHILCLNEAVAAEKGFVEKN